MVLESNSMALCETSPPPPDVLGPQEEARPARSTWRKRLLGQEGAYVLILAAAVVLIYLFGAREMRFFMVPSNSMQPTLRPSDYLITLREATYQRGDIVVVIEPDTGEYVVKRIVGLPGDRVEVHEGGLFINGQYASEPYIAEPMAYELIPAVDIPDQQVFLLGDNRNLSDDGHLSRQAQPMKDIIGRVRFRYYPYGRFGTVRSYPLTAVAEQATL